MNILFIAYWFAPDSGGVERVTSLLAKGLTERNHTVYFLSGTIKEQTSTAGCRFPIYFMDKPFSKRFDKGSVYLYRSYLKKLEIDIIINQYPIAPKSNFFIQYNLPGIKYISTYHGRPFGSELFYLKQAVKTFYRPISMKRLIFSVCGMYRNYWQFRFMVDNSDKVCVLCEGTVERIIRLCHIKDRDKLIAIPNPNTFEVARDAKPFKERQNIILFVGRVSDRVKRLDEFIKVWEKLYKINPDWKAIIIGDDRNCDRHKRYIHSRGIRNIEFAGHSSHIKEWYDRAKLVCVTSATEGWSMVISEAMSLGCVPVSYTTFDAAFELIDHKTDGLLCSPSTTGQMATLVQWAITNGDRLQSMSEKARKKVIRFSPERIVEKWESLF